MKLFDECLLFLCLLCYLNHYFHRLLFIFFKNHVFYNANGPKMTPQRTFSIHRIKVPMLFVTFLAFFVFANISLFSSRILARPKNTRRDVKLSKFGPQIDAPWPLCTRFLVVSRWSKYHYLHRGFLAFSKPLVLSR
mgnify:CR=1 FL=1